MHMHAGLSNQPMWHFISDHISRATGSCFLCQHKEQVAGGDTHQAFLIKDSSARYFVKIRPHQGPLQLRHEAEGLTAIEATNTINTPRVVCHGITDEGNNSHEYLVQGFLRFTRPEASDWRALGTQLAQLHSTAKAKASAAKFGWSHNNFLGNTEQCNDTYQTWSVFFSECRIGAMLEKLARQGHRLVNPDIFVTQTELFLHGHRPMPSLVHGDLWSGNVGHTAKGPVIFDPAVYYGDRETDIAMTELFGRLPEPFYVAYHEAAPLNEGYEQRKQLYQLYHWLNHALMFGNNYLDEAKSAIIRCQKMY